MVLRRRGIAVAVLVITATAAPPGAEADEAAVPVYGQTQLRDYSANSPQVIVSIHGVRRLPTASVIYYSLGLPKNQPEANLSLAVSTGASIFNNTSGQQACNTGAYDLKGGTAYAALRTSSAGSCFASATSSFARPKPGQAYVGYVEIAALPQTVQSVNVTMAGQIFANVPVQDGAMTPQLPTDQLTGSSANHIVLGTGWPTPAAKNNGSAQGQPLPSLEVQAKEFTFPLTQRVTAGALTQRKAAGGNLVDLSGDVLFDSGQSTLTAAGQKAIATAAAQLRKSQANSIQVTGYTDNVNTESSNVTLSRDRAASVSAALLKLIPGLKIAQDGKGESDPIASNETDAGKQLNRRVTITLPKGSN